MKDWIKRIGKFRDSFLVLAGGLYVLGYVVRSISGFNNNLGFLPAFESQYLIAGIVPAIVILAFYFLISVTWWIRKKFSNWLNSGALQIIIPILITVAYSVSIGQIVFRDRASGDNITAAMRNFVLISSYFMVGMFIKFSTVENAWKDLSDKKCSYLSKIYSLLILVIAGPYYLFIVIASKTITGIGEWIAEMMEPLTLYTIIFIILFTVLGMEHFILDVYPQIPQEFGGPRPRCALLDIKGMEISPELQGTLFPSSSNVINTDIIQSIQVDVYFSGRDFMLVKPHGKTTQDGNVTYEIQKSIVRAVIWCE